MTRPTELREMADDELATRLAEAREEYFNLRFQHVTGQLDNYARIGDVRKEIARISTILREVEIAAAEAQEASNEAERQARIDARRARVASSQRGVVAGVGREAALSQSQEKNDD